MLRYPWWVYWRDETRLHVEGQYRLREQADEIAQRLAFTHDRRYCVLDTTCDTVCSVWDPPRKDG